MNIEFEKIRFKNINSFGNAWTEFFFKKGLNLVTGSNGAGKSSFLLDVISFSLYGKPYRSIRIDELINNKNDKQLVTETYFKIDNDQYSIQRGLKPNILKIIKNDQEMELLSHKSLIQDEIDKILGINHNLFKQIISLSLLNNKPFLSLDAKDKRDITESVFNIKIFGRMLKSLKKNNSITKNTIDLNEKDISLGKEILEGLVIQIKSLTKLKGDFDSNKEKDLKNLNDKCTVLNDELRKIHISLAELDFKEIEFDEYTKKILKEKRENNQKIWIGFNNKLGSKNEELKFLEDESNDSDDFERKYNELRELVSSFYEFTKDLEVQSAKKIKEQENTSRDESEKLKSEILIVENQIKEKNKEQSFLTKDYIEKNLTEVIDKKKILSENKIKINGYKEDIELLRSKEGYCSHCKQDVPESHKLKEIESRKDVIKSLTTDNEIIVAQMENIISNHIREKNDLIVTFIEDRKEKIHDLKRTLLLNESGMRDKLFIIEADLKRSINDLKNKKEEIVLGYIRATKENLIKEIETLEKQIKENYNESKSLESKLNVLEKEEKNYLLKKSEFEKLIIQEKNIKDNMISIVVNMQEIEKKIFNADIDSLKIDFETKKKNYQESKVKCDSLKRKLKIEEVIKDVLEEQGIRKFFFSKLIPKMNLLINQYLNHFDLPIKFSFDNEFQETILEVGNIERNFKSFSGGEQARISIAIQLSFIELNKLINSFNTSILIFDEIFDTGLDFSAMELILEKLKEISDKNDIAIYVVSHKDINNIEYIDRNIRLEKINGFSKIIE